MSHLFRRMLAGGGDLTVAPADVDEGLEIRLQQSPVAIAGQVSREDVQALVQVLDDWLYDSRPGARR